jgi:serine phosphatase RsbU (regulator of sigma subunit)
MTDFDLSGSYLFRSLPPGEISGLVKALHKTEKAKDTILFREGDKADCVYIILGGEVEIIKGFETPEEISLRIMGSGNIVGEMGLLIPGGLRTATVRANQDVSLYELRLDAFEALLKASPVMGYKILQEFGARLQTTNEEVIEKNIELTHAYEELKAMQEEIIKKEKMDTELNMARRIQLSILPQEIVKMEGCDIGAKMVPARAVGGDFFDVIPLDEDRVGIAIGDVSDKGVPAAMFMAQFCTLLRVVAKTTDSPVKILHHINNNLLEMNLTGMFVTAVYGIFNRKEHTFHYGRAGHEMPVIFDKKGKASEPPHDQGAALCIFPDPPIDEQTIDVPSGSTLLLYTDGGTDATNAANELFGLKNLKKAFSSKLDHSAQALCDSVIQELIAFQEEDGQFDDITLVALRAL